MYWYGWIANSALGASILGLVVGVFRKLQPRA